MYKEDVKADLKTMAVHQQESLFFVQVDKLRPYWINSLWKTSIKLGHAAKSISLKVLESNQKQIASEVRNNLRKKDTSYTGK